MSGADARRVALRAQGFSGRTIARPGGAALLRMARNLGAIQIDSVNVLVRAQYLPAFSRFGIYDRNVLDRLAYGRPRRMFEYWGHEASLLPIELYPFFGWRRDVSRKGVGVWQNVARVGLERPDLVRKVRSEIEARGPLAASDFGQGTSTGSWWGWNDTKRAVEFLYWCGELTPVQRRTSFERVYDLSERVIPYDLLAAKVTAEDSYAHLIERAARAMGVSTESDMRYYFRLPLAAARAAVQRLVESGTLLPVRVEGWKQQAYLHKDARIPRAVEQSALISPFDSLVWNRLRMHRLFDFHYRIEIYTPAHKRIHGYYVLPYLLNEQLVARVDLKADRQHGVLLVQSVHFEPHVSKALVRGRLREDLRTLARWLDLGSVRGAVRS
ncbi:MAG TPA: crosslink repair DNA glycosylase YcaQ family protein [Candidatus Baltobacteraceae bacterium]|nr:crosslink repair DNA glycosylase YcaQ family protein [Candidatus Baltobacteraceae bacterium]